MTPSSDYITGVDWGTGDSWAKFQTVDPLTLPPMMLSMHDDEDETPAEVMLCSACLLSKWGFVDGDVLDWLPSRFDRRQVLCRLVREYLLPVLMERVEVMEIVTNHNPIRAVTVDGVDVEACWYGEQDRPTLTPAHITLSSAQVLRLAEVWFPADSSPP
ncbi:MAG: hypothetical protein V4662_11960 [Verrucomicrobiota bacterium]